MQRCISCMRKKESERFIVKRGLARLHETESLQHAPQIVWSLLNHDCITSAEIFFRVVNAVEIVLQVGCWLVCKVDRCQFFQCLTITQTRLRGWLSGEKQAWINTWNGGTKGWEADLNTYVIQGSTAWSHELSVQLCCFIDGIVGIHPFHRHIANHEGDEASALRRVSEKES